MKNITQGHISALATAIDLLSTQFEGIENPSLMAEMNENHGQLNELLIIIKQEKERQDTQREIRKIANEIIKKITPNN